MDYHSEIGKIILGEIVKEAEKPTSLSEMELKIRRVMLAIGNFILQLWLGWLVLRYPSKKRRCPHCGAQAIYQRKRGGKLRTTLGLVAYKRAYYSCTHCHQGHYPLDEELGLYPNQMSAELERLAGLLGVQQAFGQGSALFEECMLFSLSDQSLDKASQAYGQAVHQEELEWQALANDPKELEQRQHNQSHPLRLYGTLDGGRVQTRAPKGQEQPWRELKVGAWFKARGVPPSKPEGEWRIAAEEITYYSDIAPADEFSQLVWSTGVQHNAQLASELIFVADGARWIWDIVDLHFPDAIQIVDWFHACEYLGAVAKAAFRDQAQRQRWLQTVKTDLWEGRLDAVIAACAAHIQPNREDDPAQKAVTYYSNNRHRMDYPSYRANGYQIGSGTIESGVKQIAKKRMSISGARWNTNSARLVAKARAAYLSNRWSDLAQRRKRSRKSA